MPKTTVYESAFDLMDLKTPERNLMKAKSDKMLKIRDLIKEQLKLTQTKAAEICEITQPRVSKLLSGNLKSFSYDMLFLIEERLKEELEKRQ